jgi:hypothetical protein
LTSTCILKSFASHLGSNCWNPEWFRHASYVTIHTLRISRIYASVLAAPIYISHTLLSPLRPSIVRVHHQIPLETNHPQFDVTSRHHPSSRARHAGVRIPMTPACFSIKHPSLPRQNDQSPLGILLAKIDVVLASFCFLLCLELLYA